jgi:hypothetical protein
MAKPMGGAERLGSAVPLPTPDLLRRESTLRWKPGHAPKPTGLFKPSSLWDPADRRNWRLFTDPTDLSVMHYMQQADFTAPHPLTGSALYAMLIEKMHQGNHPHPSCWARSCTLVPAARMFTTGGVERGHAATLGVRGFLSSSSGANHVSANHVSESNHVTHTHTHTHARALTQTTRL